MVVSVLMAVPVVMLMAVAVFMPVLMFMVVFMAVSMVVLMPMVVFMFMALQVDVHIHTCDSLALGLLDVKVIAAYVQLGQLAFQNLRVRAQVDEGAQSHVAADAGKTVKV